MGAVANGTLTTIGTRYTITGNVRRRYFQFSYPAHQESGIYVTGKSSGAFSNTALLVFSVGIVMASVIFQHERAT